MNIFCIAYLRRATLSENTKTVALADVVLQNDVAAPVAMATYCLPTTAWVITPECSGTPTSCRNSTVPSRASSTRKWSVSSPMKTSPDEVVVTAARMGLVDSYFRRIAPEVASIAVSHPRACSTASKLDEPPRWCRVVTGVSKTSFRLSRPRPFTHLSLPSAATNCRVPLSVATRKIGPAVVIFQSCKSWVQIATTTAIFPTSHQAQSSSR